MSNPYPPVTGFFILGKSLKSHGTKGGLRLSVGEHLKRYVQPGTFLFFNLNGAQVPFRVIETDDNIHFVVYLDGVDNKEESDALSGHDFSIPVAMVDQRHLRSPVNMSEKWVDYIIADDVTQITYPINRVEEFPQQLMAIVMSDGREIMIPLSEQLITGIDKKEKVIRMRIPDGLMEL